MSGSSPHVPQTYAPWRPVLERAGLERARPSLAFEPVSYTHLTLPTN